MAILLLDSALNSPSETRKILFCQLQPEAFFLTDIVTSEKGDEILDILIYLAFNELLFFLDFDYACSRKYFLSIFRCVKNCNL